LFLKYFIQHCFICRPSDSMVFEDAGIQPRTFATLALPVSRSDDSARSHPHTNTYQKEMGHLSVKGRNQNYSLSLS
jgi:hypothetical protein